ncbi:MAG: AI-2E family transporter [Clostridia bacterium]|nr:AI-2E family transporter [Clostridia bacterium]
MKNWKIRYLEVLPVLILAMLICKLIFTTNISFDGVLSTIYSCIAYFVYGLAFAYFLNPLMMFIERKIVKEKDSQRKKHVMRGVSIAAVYLVVIGFISIFIVNIVPTIASGIHDLVSELPTYFSKLQTWATDTIRPLNPALADNFGTYLADFSAKFYGWIEQMDMSHVGKTVTNAVSVSAKTVVRVFFGIVISVYFLFGKEVLITQLKRLIYAVFSTEKAEKTLEYGRAINKIFFDFIISKIVQATVVFILGLVILVPFNIPLAPLISLLLALTNMIPYIGPWLGGIPSVLMAILFSPIKGLIVLLFIIGMQIIDNLFIGPKIMSDRVGISPLLVIAGVAIGGTFGGVIGMFIGVPLVAVIKLVFYDNFIEGRLKKKNVDL